MNNGLMISGLTIVTVAVIGLSMWLLPQYSVYQQEMSGRAALAKATEDRQIKIQEAQALKESATFLAAAEVIRAEGVRDANKIIGEGLKGNEAYIKYLWITGLSERENITTIYIPTGSNGLPIMKDVSK